jgi:hypothetical protein
MRDPDTTTQVPKACRLLREVGKESKSDTVSDLLTDDGRARALAWWDEAVPIAGTLAERYLRETRRLVLPPVVSPRVLRLRSDCPFGEGAIFACWRYIATSARTRRRRSRGLRSGRILARATARRFRHRPRRHDQGQRRPRSDDGPAHRRKARNDGHRHAVGPRPGLGTRLGLG